MSSAELCSAVARVRAELRAITAAIGDGVLVELDEQLLPELTESLFTVADAAVAAGTAVAGRVHGCGVLSTRGIISTKTWLARTARLHKREAAAVLARAHDLDDPARGEVREAWLAGRASGSQVRAIALGMRECAGHVRDPHDWQVLHQQALPFLLDTAEQGASPEELAAATKRLLNALAPDGADRSAMDAYDRQKLTSREVGDQSVSQLVLDAEGGALLRTALDAVLDRWHRTGTLADVDDPLAKLPDRGRSSREHLDAVALLAVVREWLGCDSSEHAGRSHGARPHLHVTVDLADLCSGTGSGTLAVPGRDEVVVPIATAARLACDAVVTPILMRCTHGQPLDATVDALRAASREILWVGRAQRLVTQRLWAALVARDGGCRFPGCDRDVSRCEAHHIRSWTRDLGPTDLDNLILLCSAHHHLVHEGRWRIRADDRHPPGTREYWTFLPQTRVDRPARAPAWPDAA